MKISYIFSTLSALLFGTLLFQFGLSSVKIVYDNVEGGSFNSSSNIFLSKVRDVAKESSDNLIRAYLGELTQNTTSNAYLSFEAFDAVRDFIELNNTEVRLGFVGDIMLDRGVERSVKRNGDGDYSYLFQNARYLEEVDIMFGNLEGPVSDRGSDRYNLYSFRFDPVVLPVLENAGFDVLSFANNHVGDWRREAFEDTLERFKNSSIDLVGAGMNKNESSEPVIFYKNGTRIGYLAFSDVGPNWLQSGERKPGINIIEDGVTEQIISAASDKVDFLAVSIHWGDEYVEENNRQKRLARKYIDAGADAVIGHHPHVIQNVEVYKGGVIAYSLGNYIFDQYQGPETMEGLMLILDIDRGELKKIIKTKTLQNKQYVPYKTEELGATVL